MKTQAELDEEWTKAAVAALGSFLWLGNNLHNSGTETFRELYRAALSDAQDAYEAGQARLRGPEEAQA